MGRRRARPLTEDEAAREWFEIKCVLVFVLPQALLVIAFFVVLFRRLHGG